MTIGFLKKASNASKVALHRNEAVLTKLFFGTSNREFHKRARIIHYIPLYKRKDMTGDSFLHHKRDFEIPLGVLTQDKTTISFPLIFLNNELSSDLKRKCQKVSLRRFLVF